MCVGVHIKLYVSTCVYTLHTFFSMEFFVNFLEVSVGYVSIYLGCVDACVAEHGLYTSDVSTISKEIGGK